MSSISLSISQPRTLLSTTTKPTRPSMVKMLPRSRSSSFGRRREISCSFTPRRGLRFRYGNDPEKNKEDGNFKDRFVKDVGSVVKELWLELLKKIIIDEIKTHVSKGLESKLFRYGRSFIVIAVCLILNVATKMFK